jgi:hypothetical protein
MVWRALDGAMLATAAAILPSRIELHERSRIQARRLAGLTSEAVFGKLLGLELVRTSGIDAGGRKDR